MGKNPFGIGMNVPQSKDKNFRQNLFYFMREFHINPFDETYEIYDKDGKLAGNIIKKGISMYLFDVLLKERNEHYTKEAAEMKKRK